MRLSNWKTYHILTGWVHCWLITIGLLELILTLEVRFELWTVRPFFSLSCVSDLFPSVLNNTCVALAYRVICIAEFLPKLHTLVLTNNRIVNLVEIDPLASLPKLQFLSLLDNNITKKANYRLYVINKLKSLRVLDFKKVKIKVCFLFHYPHIYFLGLNVWNMKDRMFW